jgi:hypothetical protein
MMAIARLWDVAGVAVGVWRALLISLLFEELLMERTVATAAGRTGWNP